MRRRRSPARWLAPLALVACAVAVYSVAGQSLRSADTATKPATSTTSTAESRATSQPSSRRSESKPRTYTVQPGDTLSAIAERNGITLARLQALNPRLESRALQTGQRVRLSP